jgi:hypothetical protein
VLQLHQQQHPALANANSLVSMFAVLLYPVGLPVAVGVALWKSQEEILAGSGPAALESLYRDFKPSCCMWEVYQLLQKVALIGLLGFVPPRGSLFQATVGLFLSQFMLTAMVRTCPYADSRTNALAIAGQMVITFSYFATILLKVREEDRCDYINNENVGMAMLLVNIPLGLYFLYVSRHHAHLPATNCNLSLSLPLSAGSSPLRDVSSNPARDATCALMHRRTRGRMSRTTTKI